MMNDVVNTMNYIYLLLKGEGVFRGGINTISSYRNVSRSSYNMEVVIILAKMVLNLYICIIQMVDDLFLTKW
ncbi:hypothetical protein CWI39_2165p0010 [Hamiltosporidium magnivora]|uniref:Uncharacterized protein n=1 Tax=Hamiltosporidium magnivora TaxID=148818 RepID=A0A4Q9KXX0_9MICR|nr:hypothetical protein CWI39_2165p0010 [Hamiltosporidium magnivora]